MLSFKTVNPIIKADNLTKKISIDQTELVILRNINLAIHKAESVAIVGSSGAGKTTLLGLLAGLDEPSSGSVLLGGVDIYKLNEEERTKVRGTNISFVFQNFYLLDNLTALENIMLPLELHKHKNAKETALKLINEVGLEQRANHYPSQLSGGEQQRVALARAFAVRPAILFADEPTGSLDQATGDFIIDQLFAMNKNQYTTLVIITHEENIARRCDRVIHMDRGEIDK